MNPETISLQGGDDRRPARAGTDLMRLTSRRLGRSEAVNRGVLVRAVGGLTRRKHRGCTGQIVRQVHESWIGPVDAGMHGRHGRAARRTARSRRARGDGTGNTDRTGFRRSRRSRTPQVVDITRVTKQLRSRRPSLPGSYVETDHPQAHGSLERHRRRVYSFRPNALASAGSRRTQPPSSSTIIVFSKTTNSCAERLIVPQLPSPRPRRPRRRQTSRLAW